MSLRVALIISLCELRDLCGSAGSLGFSKMGKLPGFYPQTENFDSLNTVICTLISTFMYKLKLPGIAVKKD